MDSNLYMFNKSNFKFRANSIWIDWNKNHYKNRNDKKQFAFICLQIHNIGECTDCQSLHSIT